MVRLGLLCRRNFMYSTPKKCISAFPIRFAFLEDKIANMEETLKLEPSKGTFLNQIQILAARIGLIAINIDSTLTFRRLGCESTSPDCYGVHNVSVLTMEGTGPLK